MTSLVDITPTVLNWFGIDYPSYRIFKHGNHVKLTGKSLLPVLDMEPATGWDTVYASHNLHEITMYYPMRVIRNRRYKLIHNLNSKMPFSIDQDFYVSPTFQDLLNRTKHGKPLHWSKTLKDYYYRDEWELFDLQQDPDELKNIANSASRQDILKNLKYQLLSWQHITDDPWICAPGAVLENVGAYAKNPQCMSMDNGFNSLNFLEP